MDQENKDQIPKSEGPESQTGKMINEQNAIEGQRKQVNVENYAMVSEIGQLLESLSLYEAIMQLKTKKRFWMP
jgi:hypothetical protein